MYGFTAEFQVDDSKIRIRDATGNTVITYPVLYDSLYAIYEVKDSGWKRIAKVDDREDCERVAFQHYLKI